MVNVAWLRAHAVSQSLLPEASLKTAIRRLGFVQADPIRSPARAQDLILRHRVVGYRAGDLERHYVSLDIEEDVLYAYGFLPRTVWRLLHPRNTTGMSALEKKVLETVREFGIMHPREMEAHFGRKRVINAWGSYSKATTSALDHLHYRGLLRVARRENGIRLYEATPPHNERMSVDTRLRKLVLVIAKILAPVPVRTLQANVHRFRYLGNTRSVLTDLVKTGELEGEKVDGIQYCWPRTRTARREETPKVRFLAPFDPLVWDRARFEHLWGWRYRFEAYTPPAKRLRGYYAMPMLWGDSVIGWANARVESGRLEIDTAFVEKRPPDSVFRSELDDEVERLKMFLGLNGLPS